MSPGRDKAVWELAAMNRAKIMKKRYKFAFLYLFL